MLNSLESEYHSQTEKSTSIFLSMILMDTFSCQSQKPCFHLTGYAILPIL